MMIVDSSGKYEFRLEGGDGKVRWYDRLLGRLGFVRMSVYRRCVLAARLASSQDRVDRRQDNHAAYTMREIEACSVWARVGAAGRLDR